LLKNWADGGYSGENLQKVASSYGWTIEIIKSTDNLKGFAVYQKDGWLRPLSAG
jgi:hypothetical protein